MSFKSTSYEHRTHETLTKLVKTISKDERETLNALLISKSEFKKKLFAKNQHTMFILSLPIWFEAGTQNLRTFDVREYYSFWEHQYDKTESKNDPIG